MKDSPSEIDLKLFESGVAFYAKLSSQAREIAGYCSLLYHYTSLDSLYGILASGEIWASHIGYSNDPLELNNRISIANWIAGHFSITEENAVLREMFSESYDSYVRSIQGSHSAYSISFSDSGDKLSQWRGYTDRGAGISIGLNQRRLAEYLLDHDYEATVLPILYHDHTQLSVAMKAMNSATDVLRDLDLTKLTTSQRSDLKARLSQNLSLIGAACKPDSWSEEREWRLISLGRSPAESSSDVKNIGGRLLPVKPIGLSGNVPGDERTVAVLPLQEIVVGPRLDFEQVKYALELLLQQQGYEIVESPDTATRLEPGEVAITPSRLKLR